MDRREGLSTRRRPSDANANNANNANNAIANDENNANANNGNHPTNPNIADGDRLRVDRTQSAEWDEFPHPESPTPDDIAELIFPGRRQGGRRNGTTPTNDDWATASPASVNDPLVASARRSDPSNVVRRSFHLIVAVAALFLCSGVLFQQDRGGYALEAWVTLPDLLLTAAALVFGVGVLRRARHVRGPLIVVGGVGILAVLAVSFVAHPSIRGILVLVRLLGALGLADRVVSANRAELRVLGRVVVGAVAAQLAVAGAQTVLGRPLGLSAFGERLDPFFDFGSGARVASGLLGHPYPLGGAALVVGAIGAALALRGRLSRRWGAFAGVVAGYGVVSTASRTNAFGLALVLAVVSVASFRTGMARAAGLAFVAMALSGAIGGYAANPEVWTVKARGAAAAGDVSTGRGVLLRENIDAFGRHWPTGVGPGRYNLALADDGVRQSTGVPHPPQVVVMSVLVEGGFATLGGLGLVCLAILKILRRRSAPAIVILAAIAGPLFGDHYLWTTGEGMTVVALAFGTATVLGSDGRVRELHNRRRRTPLESLPD